MNTQPINSYDYVQFFAASANTEITARLWDALMANKPRAIVVESFGSGSIPGILIDKVQTATRNGTAVFLLNGASKQNYGIIKLTYDTNTRLLEAGAVPLERINIGHLRRWAAFIDEGTRSADLPKYSGDKTDALLQTIAEIAQHESNMFELIRKVRETYRLSDEQIEEIVRNSHRKELVEISHEIKSALSQENAKPLNTVAGPITREDIENTRRSVDRMLIAMQEELKEINKGERATITNELRRRK